MQLRWLDTGGLEVLVEAEVRSRWPTYVNGIFDRCMAVPVLTLK